MKRLHFAIDINAPKEKVWSAMLDKDSYQKWTEAFGAGSSYEGKWKKGSKIRFLAPDENGKMQGIVSRIKENRKHEFVSIEHLGLVKDGLEDTASDEVKKWAGALENYTFKEKNGFTEVAVDVDTDEEYAEMFEDMWPKALQKLKKLAEK